MIQQPLDDRPGVWTNPEWRPGMPGTFAVVIGVSTYHYLDGSKECFDMGQLVVSALTARRFFEWLGDKYRLNGCPLAKCWLLLGPGDRERNLYPALTAHMLEPTFANCEQAIQEWHEEMAQLSEAAAVQSRSVFFFTGHGLEVIEDRQILLPCDYLKPPAKVVDRALSTQNIARGLKSLKVPLHFMFVDACRNDHENLGEVTPLRGQAILNEPTNRAVNPDAFVPIFYAAASGTEALQAPDPSMGLSLFGEALLDGLETRGLAPDCSRGACCIFLHLLRPFVNDRVAQISVDRYRKRIFPRVRIRGDQTEDVFTEVPQPPPPALPIAPPPPPDVLADRIMTVTFDSPVRPTVEGVESAPNRFGVDRITRMMGLARVFDYSQNKWLRHGSDLEISNLRRAGDTSALEFDLVIPSADPGQMYWLQIDDQGKSYGCPLHVDRYSNTRFRVAADYSLRLERIERFDVTLSTENEGMLLNAAMMWRAYDERSAREAAREFSYAIPFDAAQLEQLLKFKKYSPLSALIAGQILLRARDWDRLHDWLRNLANLAPELPDAGILWAEQCLRQPGRAEGTEEAVEHFLRLEGRPLPLLVESFGYALQQAEDFQREGAISSGSQRRIVHLHKRLIDAAALLRTGGLFVTFSGTTSRVYPGVMIHHQAAIKPEATERAETKGEASASSN